MKTSILLLLATGLISSALANYEKEPAFCTTKAFHALEVKADRDGLIRDRQYKIGDLTLTGLAVGHSDLNSMIRMAQEHSDFRPDEKYCTFYLNKGETDKEETFNHHYLSAPYAKFRHRKIKAQYTRVLRPVFEENQTTFVSCAKDHGYIAMGCNGQKHRGPTAVAMLLAYAGCNPNNAVNIVNQIWGKNFVRFTTRWKLANMAYNWGAKNPKNREVLQSVMLAK